MTIRLPWRLFIFYALVIAIGAAAAYVTVWLLAPAFFDHQMTMMTGGDVTAASAGPGHGATFTLILPLAPARERLAR